MSNKHLSLAMTIVAAAVLQASTSCNKPESKELLDNETSAALPPATNPNARQFTLVPDASGNLNIDNKSGTYRAGDVLNLKGNFKSVSFVNLNGASGNPIVVRNLPGTRITIGNPSWNGGAGGIALSFYNSHHVRVAGTSQSSFVINGSTQTSRPSYFNLTITDKSDNFEVFNMTINNGGTGIVAKTSPVKGDAKTFYPNAWLENLSIHDVIINGTINEGMYLGHTAIYWGLNNGMTYFTKPPGTPNVDYAQPIKWRNVKIFNNVIKNVGADGLQTAAMDNVEIYGNEITNWGTQHYYAHSGGLLVGGRVTRSVVHNNHVHHGWGDMMQFFASGEGGGIHIIRNNLFHDNTSGEGVSFRGMDNVVAYFYNNTVARSFGVSLRINGNSGMTSKQVLHANAFINPFATGVAAIGARSYVYLENNAAVDEGTGTAANTRFPSISAAGVDGTWFQPLSGSKLLYSGYRKK